jgi:hypothetical protein
MLGFNRWPLALMFFSRTAVDDYETMPTMQRIAANPLSRCHPTPLPPGQRVGLRRAPCWLHTCTTAVGEILRYGDN